MSVKAPRLGRRPRVLLGFLVAAIALAIWLFWPIDAPRDAPAVAQVKPSSKHRTVAESWRWKPAAQTVDQPRDNTPPVPLVGRIHPAAVVRALGRVELDESGKVIVNRNARDLLDDAWEELPDLTEEELEALQETLRAGLPGTQGERVAKIVTGYFRYRTALQLLERSTDVPTTLEGERTQLDYVASVRNEYLGPVVARQLYGEDQALQRYLLASKSASGTERATLQTDSQNGVFYLDSRTSPAAKELNRQMELLRAQGASDDYLNYVQTQQLGLYIAGILPRTDAEQSDWQQRYDQFTQQRQVVLAAGLSEEDKKNQIEQLLRQYFNAEELEAIDASKAQ